MSIENELSELTAAVKLLTAAVLGRAPVTVSTTVKADVKGPQLTSEGLTAEEAKAKLKK